MTAKSDVEKSAFLWRSLTLKAKKMPEGDAKKAINKAASNALRTMGKAVDAAESREAWESKKVAKPER